MSEIVTGRVLRFEANPFEVPVAEAARIEEDGAVLIENGRIAWTGTRSAIGERARGARRTDLGAALILPGFVDAHMHYPQTGMIASWGKRLIDWLNSYTFPAEARLADPEVARLRAETTMDLALDHGTTTQASFCTIHAHSVDAIFEAAAARGMAMVAGRTCMDRDTAPEALRDTVQAAYDENAALIARWHGRDRGVYAITPRFSPTSTPEQLEALGALWAEHPDCLMQTHLSEQTDEVAWVSDLYPQARDYLDTYESHGLLGARGLYGHAIHLEARERDRLREVGAGLVHCPTSNTFIGSGLFDMGRAMAEGQRVGLATDTGGGSSFSMLRTMAAAYEIGQLTGTALHPAHLLWLATEGSARVLHLSDEIGTLAPGSAADLVALDLSATPATAQRVALADEPWEAVFPTIMMGDDRAVAGVWVAGTRRR